MDTVRAVAVVGFYRGDLVEPGTILDLPYVEFLELRSMHKVDHAPAEQKDAAPEIGGASSGVFDVGGSETKKARK